MIFKPNKALIKTNPYLRNPKNRKIQFFTAVVTSTGIEGVAITPAQLRKTSNKTNKKR